MQSNCASVVLLAAKRVHRRLGRSPRRRPEVLGGSGCRAVALTIATMHPGTWGITPRAWRRLQSNCTGYSKLPRCSTSMGADATASCDGPALTYQANEIQQFGHNKGWQCIRQSENITFCCMSCRRVKATLPFSCSQAMTLQHTFGLKRLHFAPDGHWRRVEHPIVLLGTTQEHDDEASQED